MDTKDITSIIKEKYSGYIWKSDQPAPEVFIEQEVDLQKILDEMPRNAFIVEGMLKNGINSYSIKYVDGKYYVTRYTFSELEKVPCQSLFFEPKRMKNVKKMQFHQYWREEGEPFCEGMKVLIPAEFVFMGFVLLNE